MTTRKRPSLYDHLRLGQELPFVALYGAGEWHRLDPRCPGYTLCDLVVDPWMSIFARDLGIGATRCRVCLSREAT
jgi:hypothetical protein